MRRIKNVSAQILREKVAETAAVPASDSTLKRDIMSLLVQARTAEASGAYKMSDEMMMEQMVGPASFFYDKLP